MTTRIVTDANGRKHITNEPLLHPPQRTWVGLTDDELFKIWMGAPAETEDRFAFVNAVISKLKEKNT